MQTKNLKKKGFTLVELVVVVAVIAVLSAILIPTIGCFVEQAKETNDMATVRLLNTALVEDEAANGTPATMTQALAAMDRKGYDIEKLNLRSTGEIYWDGANNRFMLLKGDEVLYGDNTTPESERYNWWKLLKNGDELSATYSNYLKEGYEVSGGALTISTGLDVGENTGITAVTYANDGTAKNVVIRTNGGELTVNAPLDTVDHYGKSDTVNIIAINNASYHEYGTIDGNVSIAAGHLKVEQGSKINGVVITANDIMQDGNGKYNVSVEIDNNANVDYVLSSAEINNTGAVTKPEITKVIDKSIQSENAVAYDLTKGEYLTSLSLSNGSHIVLLKNVEASESIEIYLSGKIDLNGYNITAPNQTINLYTTLASNALALEIVGNGMIMERVPNGFGAITINNKKSAFSSIKLTVGKNVTLCGWTGIGIMSQTANNYKNITVDFSGKIISSAPADTTDAIFGHGIYVNGLYKDPDKCPEIILRETVEIDQGKGTAIYAAGYANWTIYGGKYKAGECFEIKSGNVNIYDGTFEATESKSHEENNNGTSASGYAIAIVNNNNYAKPLTVSILNGIFNSDVEILDDQEILEYKASLSISGGSFVNDITKYKKN